MFSSTLTKLQKEIHNGNEGGSLWAAAPLSLWYKLKNKLKPKNKMASAKKQKRVLFFLAGSVPTEEEKKAAQKIEGNVVFRNGSAVKDTDSLEPADAVAGNYPKRYEGIAELIGKAKKAKKAEPKGEEIL